MNYILIGNLKQGGAERQVSYISELVTVSKVFSFSSDNFYNIDKHVPLLEFLRSNKFLILLISPIFLFFKISSKDTMLSFMEFSNFINIILGFLRKHRVLISIRTNPERYEETLKGRLVLKVMKFLYRYADVVICNTKELEDILLSMGFVFRDLRVVNNLIDTKKIQLQQTTVTSKKTLIFCGRFNKVKNIESIIEIMNIIYKKDNNFKLVLIGDGQELDNIKKLVSSYNLDEFVHFVGKVENPFNYFYNGSVLLLTSFYEGSPNVIIEALACGIPVISGNCRTGPTDILTDSNRSYGKILAIPNTKELYNLWASEVMLMVDNEYETYKSLSLLRSKDFDKNLNLDKWNLIFE